MKIILTFLIVFFTNIYAKDKNILILNSYHKGFEVSDIIIENIPMATTVNYNGTCLKYCWWRPRAGNIFNSKTVNTDVRQTTL